MSSTHTDEMLRLVVVSRGNDHGRQVVLGGPRALVGRSTECDIRFDDPHVSRRHASLVQRGGTLYVQDLDSTSGTYVNGVRVGGPHVLWPGDVVAFAGVELRLGPELGGPADPAAPAPERQPATPLRALATWLGPLGAIVAGLLPTLIRPHVSRPSRAASCRRPHRGARW